MGSSPYAKVAWGIDLGDPENTLAAPAPDELAAFGKVTDRLAYDGGPPKLLLMAMYG